MTGIYVIRRLVDGRCYVGSAKDIKRRWQGHRGMLDTCAHHSPYLQHSWDKHGAAAHEFVVLELCAEDDLIVREQYYIDTLDSTFNVSRVAGSRRGVPQPRTTVEYVAALNRGKKRSAETRAKMSAWQKGQPKPSSRGPKSAECRRNLSIALTGKVVSAQARANMSAGQRGRRHTAESKAKMSAARLGGHHTPETKAKIGAASVGNTHGHGHKKTPEQIAKTRAFHLGRRRSEATCEHMREAWVIRRQQQKECE